MDKKHVEIDEVRNCIHAVQRYRESLQRGALDLDADGVMKKISQRIEQIPAADVYPREQIAREIFNDLLKKMTLKRESIGDFYEITSIGLEEIARKYTVKKEGAVK